MKSHEIEFAMDNDLTPEERRQIMLMRHAIQLSQLSCFVRLLDYRARPVDVNIHAIAYACVEDDMVRFIAPQLHEKQLHRFTSLSEIEKELAPPLFVRVSKNYLVNVFEVLGVVHDRHEIVMRDGFTIHYTRAYSSRVQAGMPRFFLPDIRSIV